MSITQSECGFVALGIQHAMHMQRIVICGLPRSIRFFPQYLIKGMIFEKKCYRTQSVFNVVLTVHRR